MGLDVLVRRSLEPRLFLHRLAVQLALEVVDTDGLVLGHAMVVGGFVVLLLDGNDFVGHCWLNRFYRTGKSDKCR